jgi:hypothetical protein
MLRRASSSRSEVTWSRASFCLPLSAPSWPRSGRRRPRPGSRGRRWSTSTTSSRPTRMRRTGAGRSRGPLSTPWIGRDRREAEPQGRTGPAWKGQVVGRHRPESVRLLKGKRCRTPLRVKCPSRRLRDVRSTGGPSPPRPTWRTRLAVARIERRRAATGLEPTVYPRNPVASTARTCDESDGVTGPAPHLRSCLRPASRMLDSADVFTRCRRSRRRGRACQEGKRNGSGSAPPCAGPR